VKERQKVPASLYQLVEKKEEGQENDGKIAN